MGGKRHEEQKEKGAHHAEDGCRDVNGERVAVDADELEEREGLCGRGHAQQALGQRGFRV
jgi:hypothetical protein